MRTNLVLVYEDDTSKPFTGEVQGNTVTLYHYSEYGEHQSGFTFKDQVELPWEVPGMGVIYTEEQFIKIPRKEAGVLRQASGRLEHLTLEISSDGQVSVMCGKTPLMVGLEEELPKYLPGWGTLYTEEQFNQLQREEKHMLKPFDLEKAKAGAPVCLQDGTPVRIICWDAKGDYPIIALFEELSAERVSRFNFIGNGTGVSLKMAPVVRTGYVWFHPRYSFPTLEGAMESEPKHDGAKGHVLAKVTWEE